MKNVGRASVALVFFSAISMVAGSATATPINGGVALATPVTSLYEVSMAGFGDVTWDAPSGEFSLGADVDNLAFWQGDQEIGTRELQLHFLADAEVSLDLLFATADSKPYDTATVSFDGDNPFSKPFAGKKWWDMKVEKFAFERSFTAGAGDTLSISLSTSRDEIYESGIVGTLDITPTTPTAPVPEPATMLLFGTGLAGLAGLRRKTKCAKCAGIPLARRML